MSWANKRVARRRAPTRLEQEREELDRLRRDPVAVLVVEDQADQAAVLVPLVLIWPHNMEVVAVVAVLLEVVAEAAVEVSIEHTRAHSHSHVAPRTNNISQPLDRYRTTHSITRRGAWAGVTGPGGGGAPPPPRPTRQDTPIPAPDPRNTMVSPRRDAAPRATVAPPAAPARDPIPSLPPRAAVPLPTPDYDNDNDFDDYDSHSDASPSYNHDAAVVPPSHAAAAFDANNSSSNNDAAEDDDVYDFGENETPQSPSSPSAASASVSPARREPAFNAGAGAGGFSSAPQASSAEPTIQGPKGSTSLDTLRLPSCHCLTHPLSHPLARSLSETDSDPTSGRRRPADRLQREEGQQARSFVRFVQEEAQRRSRHQRSDRIPAARPRRLGCPERL